MAVTAQEVFEITMDLIDERLETGVISESDTKSYNVKTPGLLTLLQAELVKQGDIYSTYEISNKPIENILGFRSNFDIQAFEGEELTFEANKPAKAYYFEVDNDATVYVEDFNGAWNTLATINATPTKGGFTAYKGIVTPSNGATKSRLRFGGTYYYRTVNRSLFNVPLASSDVPDYRPWVKKQMPDDFKSVNEIIKEYADQYSQDASYKWEGKRDLYINYYYNGNIRIVYRPIPSVIATLTDTMQVDDITSRTIIPYGLAAHLLLTENPDSANYFQERYEELKYNATQPQPTSEEQITNLYGGFG
jgi:hypothetical protein